MRVFNMQLEMCICVELLEGTQCDEERNSEMKRVGIFEQYIQKQKSNVHLHRYESGASEIIENRRLSDIRPDVSPI